MQEENGIVAEATYRVNMKQTSKGDWYAEMTCRADSIEDLKTKFEEMKVFVLAEVKKLNGGQKWTE